MSVGRVLLVLGRLLTVVVLVASGTYVLVYLVRWEWTRALVAGIFFLAAEAVLLTGLVLTRVRALESRVTAAQQRAEAVAVTARAGTGSPGSRGPFRWLSPNDTAVLLPILLGAGVILSAISYVVEQVARVASAPGSDDELGRGLALVALPEQGVVPTGEPRHATAPPRVSTHRDRAVWTWAALAGIAALFALIIVAMVQALRTVPAPASDERRLTIDAVVLRHDLDRADEDVLKAVWSICQVRVPRETTLASVSPVQGTDTHRLVVYPAPGISDTRELLGCLQDAIVERARVDVIAVSEDAAPPRAAAPAWQT